MVSNVSILLMFVSLIISVGFPIGLFIYLRKKENISIKAVGVGALTFFVFAMLLEQILHTFVFQLNPYTKELMKNTLMYAIYGSLAAGIFEEVGRFISYKLMLKNKTEWKDGVAFGIGHGGIEAILLMGISSIQMIIFAFLINANTFDTLLGSKLPVEAVNQIKNSLLNTPTFLFAVGGLERVMAITAQIAFSLIVLYGIKNRKRIYLLWAILFHATMDFPVALAQRQVLETWIVELFIFVFFIISIVLTVKLKEKFKKEKDVL